MQTAKRISGSLVLSILACTLAWAQATAQISGSVSDANGGVLPGVEISVTQTDTGISRSTLTNETGSYVLSSLPLGPYRVEATLPGFQTFVQTGALQVNDSRVINVVLQVGQVTETIEVQANAAQVETRSSTLGSLIENERILELPLNGRQVTDLIVLAGGAVRQADAGTRVSIGESPMLAIAGSSGFGVDYTLDGADHTNVISRTTMLMPFPDATQEFKVESSGVTAQRGNSSSVAAVTKSGTNEFHGDLFEFVRNDLFNARQYFAPKGSTLKRNQFGGTIGGPIVKNKLFFFSGYQGTTTREDPGDVRNFIPTPAMMAGDWTAFTSPACNNGQQVTLRAPFVNNRIDPRSYSPAAVYVVTKPNPLPFPTTDNPCGEFTSGVLSSQNDGIYVGKVDYQASSNHSLFGRALIGTQRTPNPSFYNTNAIQASSWISGIQHSYSLGSTYLMSSTAVQSFRLAVNRTAKTWFNHGAPGTKPSFNWCDAGVKVYCGPDITLIKYLSISGGFSYGAGGGPGDFVYPHGYTGMSYAMNEDVNLVRGAHQLALGLSAVNGRSIGIAPFASVNQFVFNGSVTGNGLADFMVGRPASYFTGTTITHKAAQTTAAVYATDTWKATPKLTLNLGLRWEPTFPQNVEAISNFSYDRFRQGIKSTVFRNAPTGVYFRGDPGFPKNAINPQWRQFAPRVGLAWDVNGDGRTSVRASYALGYVIMSGDYRLNTHSGQAPWGSRVSITTPKGGLDDPWLDVPGGNIFPFALDQNVPFPPQGLYITQPYDLKTSYSQSWNLTLQKQIGAEWVASASYLGSNTVHIWGNQPINTAIYFPGVANANGQCFAQGYTLRATAGAACSTAANLQDRRPITLERPADGALMSWVTETDDGGVQSYHGMLLSLERRVARGISVRGNYTWSRCIGPYATLYSSLGDWTQDTYGVPNSNRDRGNCNSDRRQLFNLTALAETPQFANRTLRAVASAWKVSGIYRWSAGSPLNILAGADQALTGYGIGRGAGNQRANQVLEDPYGDRSAGPLSAYLNPRAFALPALGTYGNVARNNVEGPGTWSFDLSMSKAFAVRENQRLEFRAEAYNVTNSFRPTNPAVNVRTPNTFGLIRNSSDPRILQFALKYTF